METLGLLFLIFSFERSEKLLLATIDSRKKHPLLWHKAKIIFMEES